MFKDVLRATDLGDFAIIGLVIFVAVFLLVTVWVFTRPKKKVSRWSRIPLDDTDPVDPRDTGNRGDHSDDDQPSTKDTGGHHG